MATGATPPIPPNIAAQQMPSALRFMQSAGGPQGAGAAPPSPGHDPNSGKQFDSMSFVEDRMNQIASLLKDVADVLVLDKPALMPIIQRMSQAGSAIMQEIQTGQANQGPSPGPNEQQAQLPNPGTTGGAVSMS